MRKFARGLEEIRKPREGGGGGGKGAGEGAGGRGGSWVWVQPPLPFENEKATELLRCLLRLLSQNEKLSQKISFKAFYGVGTIDMKRRGGAEAGAGRGGLLLSSCRISKLVSNVVSLSVLLYVVHMALLKLSFYKY